jgi:hypothetical protein
MDFIEKIQTIITEPKKFFESVKKEKDIVKPWIYFIIITSIIIFFNIFTSSALLFTEENVLTNHLQELSVKFYGINNFAIGLQILFTAVMTLVSGIIGFFTIFISIAIIHLLLKLVGSKENFVESVKLICYSYTIYLFNIPITILYIVLTFYPSLVDFALILQIILSFIIYGYLKYVQIIAAMQLHKLSFKKALMGLVIIPLIAIIIIMVIAVIIGIALALLIASQTGGIESLTGLVTNFIN